MSALVKEALGLFVVAQVAVVAAVGWEALWLAALRLAAAVVVGVGARLVLLVAAIRERRMKRGAPA
jgi:hypothetical protein